MQIQTLKTKFITFSQTLGQWCYYIEAHPVFGPLCKQVVNAFQEGNKRAFSSVITLTEVLPKPIESSDEKLARKFADFLKRGKNLTMVEISESIAESAGKLRGHYPFLKTVDAIQIATSLDVGAARGAQS